MRASCCLLCASAASADDFAASRSLETTRRDFSAANEECFILVRKPIAVFSVARHFSVSSWLEVSEKSDTRGTKVAWYASHCESSFTLALTYFKGLRFIFGEGKRGLGLPHRSNHR